MNKRELIIHGAASVIQNTRPTVPSIKVILEKMLKELDELGHTVVLYDAMVNADSTEGRGPMRSVGMFQKEADAFNAIKGKGPMGCSNGDIYKVTITNTGDQSSTSRERVYGYGRDWDGKWREHWFDGRDRPDKDPEFSEYQRLKRKFEK